MLVVIMLKERVLIAFTGGTNRLETGEFVVEAPSGGISHTNSSGSLPLSASGNTPANNLITTTSTTSSTTTNSTGIPAAAGGSADMRVILFTRPFSKVPNVIVLRYDPAVPVSARTYKRYSILACCIACS